MNAQRPSAARVSSVAPTAAPPTQGAEVALCNLTLGHDRHPAVHHVEARLEPGSLTALVGPNGSGKSTLLRGIMGELRPMTGQVVLQGAARGRIAYLPQLSRIDRSFPLTVSELVASGLWHLTGIFGGLRADGRARLSEALAAVGMAGSEARSIAALSGGQMQRILFARVLLQDAPLILLDEPFAAIDERTTDDLLDLIDAWHAEGRTVVAVLHDLDMVRARFPNAMLLAREIVAHGPSGAVLSEANLARARARLAAAAQATPDVCEIGEAAPAPALRAVGGEGL
ncbi:MAG: ABC transporter ATP-binding protein [Rhodobacteraceae bacterium]|nr:ABC transporter ATP-binding protein [Paracoccaceae bacterium]